MHKKEFWKTTPKQLNALLRKMQQIQKEQEEETRAFENNEKNKMAIDYLIS